MPYPTNVSSNSYLCTAILVFGRELFRSTSIASQPECFSAAATSPPLFYLDEESCKAAWAGKNTKALTLACEAVNALILGPSSGTLPLVK